MLKRLFCIVLLGFFGLAGSQLFGQQFSDKEYKAAFVFKFSDYVTWKNGTKYDKFVIGVFGSDDDVGIFEKICAGRKKDKLPVSIAKIDDPDNISYTQILYVTKENCKHLQRIKESIKKKTLLVSENCDSEKFIMINFIEDQANGKFELNIKNILFAELEISRKIVTLGGGQEANWQDLFVKTDKQLDNAKLRLEKQMREIQLQQKIIDEKTKILAEQEDEINKQQEALTIQQLEMDKRENILGMQNIAIKEQKSKMSEQQKVLDSQAIEINRQKLILYLFSALSLLLIGLGYFIYRSYKIKKRANLQLEEKNSEITKQNEEILLQRDEIQLHLEKIQSQRDELISQNEAIFQQKEEIQTQAEHLQEINSKLARTNEILTSSIDYAKKIQDAILPSPQIIKQYLPDSFIYFKPRDIVSGDFYWFAEKHDTIYIAAVDCTGHGVPGAFMSMIGNTLLNEIVHEKTSTSPAIILDKMNQKIIYSLQQGQTGEETQDDGMDITLCAFDRKKNKIQLACANHMAYLINDKEIEIIDGDIFSIGDPLAKIREMNYADINVDIKKGSCLYIFSDGYQDQFGGNDDSKFMAGRMQKLLIQNQHLSMEDQYKVLDDAFVSWKGDTRQLDDVLVIGMRF